MRISDRRIVARAEQDAGRTEQPLGSNRGPWLDTVQRAASEAHGWGDWLLGQPWCGTWAWYVYDSLGVPEADNPAHPSTEEMWQKAIRKGTLTTTPIVGGPIVWRGIHTGIVVAVGPDVVHTIEGNSSDMVARRIRPRNGTHRYIAPTWIVQGTVRTEYWLEDLKANPRVWGPWKRLAQARRALAGMPPARRNRSVIVQPGGGGYAIREGSPKRYGPWAAEASRKNAQAALEKRLGRRLRPFNKTITTGATAAATGTATGLEKTI